MRFTTWCADLLGIALAVMVSAGAANAQATRTWISGVGDDVNPCSRTAPCKTFPGAISKTAAGGEIDTLDPGGFGAVTVVKAITLASEGTGEAGILVAGTNGVTVNCTTDPSCTVILRGLQIDGGPNGSNSLAGVKFIAGGTLMVQNCVIRNFTGGNPNGYGIAFTPSGASTLLVTDTTITSNGQAVAGSGGGILIQPTSGGSAQAALMRVNLANNALGVRGDASSTTGTVSVSMTDSVVLNSAHGALTSFTAAGGGKANFMINHTVVSNNNVGLNANGSGATMRIGNSVVNGNATAVKIQNSGVMTSYGTNQIDDNTALGQSIPVLGPT